MSRAPFIFKSVSKVWSFIIDLIFPPSPQEAELRALSPDKIFQALPPAPFPPQPFITSLFAYKHPLVSALIWNIKYKKDKHAIAVAGYALYTQLSTLNEHFILVPVPVSKQRRKERGYNQCELLIDEIMKLDAESQSLNKFGKDFDLLVRAKHTERQTLKNRKERLESTSDVFEIGVHLPDKSAPIAIIDDVTTTGSTLKEARDILTAAGYENVRALTIAH